MARLAAWLASRVDGAGAAGQPGHPRRTVLKRICSIYRSPKRNEMYLYVLKSDVLKRVPPELLVAFGKPVHAFDLVLSPERALSRED
ncbi:hypothetical protein ALQ67_05110, partial [Pseudomonas savastanoi pv. glycinea]